MEQILLTPKELRRYEMVQARLKHKCKIEEILSKYGISIKAFYSNLHKFENEGIEGLKTKSGKHRKTADEVEIKFEAIFKEHPYFSSYEFTQIINLNPRTIQRIIQRKRLTQVYRPKKERLILLRKLKEKKKIIRLTESMAGK